VCFATPTRLDHWCAAEGHPEAIVAGFFVRDPYRPLGEVRVGGSPVAHEPIAEPWAERRACVHVDGSVRLAARGEVADEPPGDLVQAGPMLVRDGRSVIDGAARIAPDRDVGVELRRPVGEALAIVALGASDDELLAVCCDGRRSGVDAGLELAELARLLVSFGAREAINLDGGGSATLVHRGHLLNRPYSNEDQPAPESRPVVTALLFERD
jgi:exopolysaccharide biosynthesis protein